ncbi:PTS sugar transporter subunit IIB [Bacillus sp. X1(2014)]|uniref:PTS sugar transporter subunit IIB n=1 Tax=Bacillus sp. X1(2014) TaxID=1565991 RepID=UPI0011A71E20|nr:PTS sugar transporter subunit IIB [Bacillus sp. X1(2014)]
MKILLCCGAGASTSLVAQSMMNSLPENEKANYVINAITYDLFLDHYKNYDVVLLGPQIRYKKKSLEKEAMADNIPVDVINSVDYALQNGTKIIEHAKQLYKKAHGA